MHYLFTLGVIVLCTLQTEATSNRCDEPLTVRHSTICTSCAAAPAIVCPKSFKKTSTDDECRYRVQIGSRQLELPGCSRSCEKVTLIKRCCPGFFGSLCSPCPKLSGKVCNWHGTCMDGESGNGTCVCEEGFSGFACQKCSNEKAYGERCSSVCDCVHGTCNSGPDGDGRCYCQPPYSGPKCDQVTSSCSDCSPYSYCKGEGPSAKCECLSSFSKVGKVCVGICTKDVCDMNAVCLYNGKGQFQCTCKTGFEGDGKFCTPINSCSNNNGGCPTNSTVCESTGPGQSICVCQNGMEGSDPRAGCTLKSACKADTCHMSARCETGQDGIARCVCSSKQISDGWRCYGDIMERVLELDREGSLAGNLSGSIALFERGCKLILSTHGPFTAFIPVDTSQISVGQLNQARRAEAICKHHLILGQRLYKNLEGQDLWTYGGEIMRFKLNKRFISKNDPDTPFKIIKSDIPASNGIIHIVDKVFTFATKGTLDSVEFSSKTIGDILAEDARFNRFVSLIDNCGIPMPLQGPGPLTLFVPTNKAVDRSRDGSIIYMLKDAKHKLQELLKHHMFSQAAVTVDQLASMTEIQTMANQVIIINATGDGRVLLTEKGIPLEVKDIVASNGIIHVIDGLLVPPSIVPIMPHRCDVNETAIVMTECVWCNYISEVQCPPGSQEENVPFQNCNPPPDPRWNQFANVRGCAKYCRVNRKRAECCKGFFGSDCKPCIGGFQHPCYDKGICSDGIYGDGSCKCNPGFMGIGCHICSDPKKHGENCDEDCRCIHGLCDNRPGSQGVCRRNSCLLGYTGELCDLTAKLCDSDGASEHCHIHAYCTRDGLMNTCVCNPGYDGDGYSCTEANMCLKPDRGGCHTNAQCVYAGPGNVSCVCNEGWIGDGAVCVEINNCLLENRGGCHISADCTPTGPGQNQCVCKKGFMGDGIMCESVNPCQTDNGGCHEMAACSFNATSGVRCTCPEDYKGDGITCYGNILMELDGNADFSSFNRYLQRQSVISAEGNVTALVPSKDAFRNMTESERLFWTDIYRLPYTLQAHFLDGIYTYDDLKKQVNKTVQTKFKTKWQVTIKNKELMIDNAAILVPDLQAINGFIHIINKVLIPDIADLPPPPPELMEVLSNTPSLSLFRKAVMFYNLTESITTRDFTVFVPSDNAIKDYLEQTNSTQLTENIVKYHVIPREQLFPEHLTDGMLKTTLLGKEYQIMFHSNRENKTLINDVPLDGIFTELRHGAMITISQVLVIHKNYCNKEVYMRAFGRCGPCDSAPKCSYGAKPVKDAFPLNMKSNCKYTKRIRQKRKLVAGCKMDCIETAKDHTCCPGYFGHDCFKCPGTVDNWCSNNGKCLDGLLGSGECLCNEGFHGTACEMCEPGRYGKDCKSECHCDHGKCLDGFDGNGQCICYRGWKGVTCSVEIVNDACGGICDQNANCFSPGSGANPTCICAAGYHGNGTFCQETDLCATNNGGCSQHANCTKVSPGERSCTCKKDYTGDGTVCLEIDPCLVNNGGCSQTTDCIKTGPNMAACVCKPGYAAKRSLCMPINPCLKDNGGCSINAMCLYIGPGERNCTCRYNYKGNGIQCMGTVSRELLHNSDANWFRKNLAESRVRDLYSKGPFTLFVPHADYIGNYSIEIWEIKKRSPDLLRYHLVGFDELSESKLRSLTRLIAASGHVLNFSVRDGAVYINGNTKIISSDYQCSNGVIHFIDKVLVPYELKNETKSVNSSLNVMNAAEAYGYTMFGSLLQKANLVDILQHSSFQPFTMFWPTDKAFNSLPQEQKNWLYSEDHFDKLQAYIKFHIIREEKAVAVSLPRETTLRTMYGSKLTFSYSQDQTGDILINGNDAKIVERHLQFMTGIAHGIDKVLEPPNIGAHCDDFSPTEIKSRCGSCLHPPNCPYSSVDSNKTSMCNRPWNHYRRHYFYDDIEFPSYRLHSFGCQRLCTKMSWVSKCCKNHYGRNCQVCPGGLEAPCGSHGDCDDGQYGTGECKCHSGFTGTACTLCKEKHYGPNCTACSCTLNGKCEDGIDGDGSCFCQEGWTGVKCESKIDVKPVCSPECHSKAVCLPENQCQCEPSYEGDGYNCTAPDLCNEYNGGCHVEANCTQSDIKVTCTCKAGYSGDGSNCSPINLCVEENNGGCSDFANCIFIGPNERRCECLQGYVGNGVQCFEKVVPPVDRCLENNGDCNANAICKDLHFHSKTAGVFHLRSPAGKYMMNYTTAEAACKAEGATLATLAQLSDAQQMGMHLCVAGWFDGKNVGYPIRFPSAKCGDNHVGIVKYKDPEEKSLYDAYCYSIREVTCECGPGYVGDGEFCNGNLASVIATHSNLSIFYSLLVKYAEIAVEGKKLLDFLSSSSTNTTLFVPYNAGFSGNKTLSFRDMEYHVSLNNTLHYFDDLKHNTAIPSRLGYDLKVIIVTNNETQTEDSLPVKLVNERKILVWDIAATNGLIQIIEGPLKAPTVPPSAPSHQKSSSSTMTAILIVIFIGGVIAGVAFCFQKHKNNAFRFQYFKASFQFFNKNDDEDGTSPTASGNNDIVSIQNPLYSGYRAFAEPFGEGEQCESSASVAGNTPTLQE
ncbi:stabilin-1 precursor [Silurus meridionalis]|nr:stabilin-1 precursor [Silurus meridionalis]